jgi:hypothetical protein
LEVGLGWEEPVVDKRRVVEMKMARILLELELSWKGVVGCSGDKCRMEGHYRAMKLVLMNHKVAR